MKFALHFGGVLGIMAYMMSLPVSIGTGLAVVGGIIPTAQPLWGWVEIAWGVLNIAAMIALSTFDKKEPGE